MTAEITITDGVIRLGDYRRIETGVIIDISSVNPQLGSTVTHKQEKTMQNNSAITIEFVGNGFIVSERRDGGYRSGQRVFQTMKELQAFLPDHFQHRAKTIKTDTKDVEATKL